MSRIPRDDPESDRGDRLPDRNDHHTAMALKCSACAAVSTELFERMYTLKATRAENDAFDALLRDRHDKENPPTAEEKAKRAAEAEKKKKANSKRRGGAAAPKKAVSGFEWTEAMEDTCKYIAKSYGLEADANGDATTNYASYKRATSLVSGGWISSELFHRCSNLLERYERQIIRFVESDAVPSVLFPPRSNAMPTDEAAREAKVAHLQSAADAAAQSKKAFSHRLCVELDKTCTLTVAPGKSDKSAEAEVVSNLEAIKVNNRKLWAASRSLAKADL